MSLNRKLISAIKYSGNSLSEKAKVPDFIQNMDAEALNKPMGHFRKTALSEASTVGNIDAINLLLAKPNIDVNVKDSTKFTPLHLACHFGHHQIVAKLLAKPGIDVNATTNHGRTPIMQSVWGSEATFKYSAWGHEAAFKLMLDDPRVNLEAKDDEGKGLDEFIARVGINFSEQTLRKYLAVKKQKLEEQVPQSDAERAASDQRKQEAVSELLECPICIQTMRPPSRIWMCGLAHVVCESCVNRLGGMGSLCPTCKSKQINLRAFHLEKFAQKVFNV